MRPSPLFLAAACALSPAFAQTAAPVATPERDAAALYVAQGGFIVTRLAGECLALVGRAESPDAFTQAWKQRNERYVTASTRYMERRVQEAAAAGGKAQGDAVQAAFRKAVQANADAEVRSLLQGSRTDGCMYGITLIEGGALDIGSKTPQYRLLEALANWAAQ
jgi:hypothetical protein